MFKKVLKFVVYAIALYIVFQIVVVVVFGINFLWANRLPSKKDQLEKEYVLFNNMDSVQVKQFKSTKGYFQFLATGEADSLRHYLDLAMMEMNKPNSSSNSITKNQ